MKCYNKVSNKGGRGNMKIMYKLVLYGPISDAIVSESKKYYSNYYEAMATAEKRTKLTGLIWIVKPVRLN